MTRSIDRLNKTAKVIAQGGFSERVRLKSKDEIEVLANNFNEMAAVVEDKISDLERLNEQKQRFIDNFTHKLKTPLTSIIGYANFMRTVLCNPNPICEAQWGIWCGANAKDGDIVKISRSGGKQSRVQETARDKVFDIANRFIQKEGSYPLSEFDAESRHDAVGYGWWSGGILYEQR